MAAASTGSAGILAQTTHATDANIFFGKNSDFGRARAKNIAYDCRSGCWRLVSGDTKELAPDDCAIVSRVLARKQFHAESITASVHDSFVRAQIMANRSTDQRRNQSTIQTACEFGTKLDFERLNCPTVCACCGRPLTLYYHLQSSCSGCNWTFVERLEHDPTTPLDDALPAAFYFDDDGGSYCLLRLCALSLLIIIIFVPQE
jgi:hypothetical protein